MRILTLAICLTLVACSGDGGSDPLPQDGSAGSDASAMDDATPSDDVMAPQDAAQTSDTAGPTPDVVEPTPDATEPIEDAGVTEPEDTTSDPVHDATPGDDTMTPPPEDAGPGGGGENTLLCHVLCDSVWNNCGGYGPYGVDQDSCVVACEALGAESLDPLVGLVCMSDSCDEVLCAPEAGPFAIHPDCQAGCELFEGCGLMSVVQPSYPDLLELCPIECSVGFIFQAETMSEIVGCVISGLEESCDPEIFSTCLPQDPGGPSNPEVPGCTETCEMAVQMNCPPWEDGPEAWADPMGCMMDCQTFEDDPNASAATLYGCAIAASCEGLTKCMTPPVADSANCEAFCDKLFGACGTDFMPSVDFCVDYCTGQMMVHGDTVSPEDANACMNATPMNCEEDVYGSMLGCLTDLGEACDTICETMTTCQGDGAEIGECLSTCNAGFMSIFSGSTTEDLAQCMTEAAGDCTAVELCMTGPQPPPCYLLCNNGEACESDTELCTDDCETTVADGGLADVLCELTAGCQADGMCDDLPIDSPPAECVDACAGVSEDTCGAYPGGCLAACQGLFIGSGGSDPSMPFCMAPLLGPDCFVDQAYWSCKSF